MDNIHAKVQGINLLHARVKSIWGELIARFRPFVGQELDTAEGEFKKKVRNALEGFNWNLPKTQIYRYPDTAHLVYHVQTDVSRDGISVYSGFYMYLGDMKNGVLTRLNETPFEVNTTDELRSDYTVEEIRELIQKVQQKKKELNKAYSNLSPFSENLKEDEHRSPFSCYDQVASVEEE